jgi:sugar phosphate isomerase/epimerase
MAVPKQRFGAHTFGFAFDCNAEAAFVRLIEHGFTTIELMATPPHFNPWSSPLQVQARLRRMIEDAGGRLLALDLASSDINLASPAPEVVDFSVESYGALVDRASELGAEAICIGSGRRHMLLPDVNAALMPSFQAAFERIHARAVKAGLTVLIENHPQGLLASADAIRAFIRAGGYSETGVIYDVANALAIGEPATDGLTTLGDLTRIIHVSDSPKGAWRHDAIGSGDIDFTAILAHLGRTGFSGPVVLETLAPDPMAAMLDGARRLEAMT